MIATALGLLAAALLVGGGRPAAGRLRGLVPHPSPSRQPDRPLVLAVLLPAGGALGWAVGGPAGAVVGAVAGGAVLLLLRRAATRSGTVDAGDLAAAWDLLATCLAAGLTVPVAVAAAARRLPGPAGDALRRVSGLLALGADPAQAWSAVSGTRSRRLRPRRRAVGDHRRRARPGGPLRGRPVAE